jgi:hypothetical protein
LPRVFPEGAGQVPIITYVNTSDNVINVEFTQYLTLRSPYLFSDGFESGNTAVWSADSP